MIHSIDKPATLPAERVEAFLDQGLFVGEGEREALLTGRWPNYIRQSQPPRWKPIRRYAWSRAFSQVLSRRPRTETVDALMLPVWCCDNSDNDEPSSEWMAATLVVVAEETPVLAAGHLAPLTVVAAKATRYKCYHVVQSSSFPAQLDLPYRNAMYGCTLSARVYQVTTVRPSSELLRVEHPSKQLNPYSLGVISAVELDVMSPTERLPLENAVRTLNAEE